MEAVIESLKDLEVRHPHSEEQKSSVGSKPPEPSRRDDPDNASTREQSVSSTADPATTISALNGKDMASELQSHDTSISYIITTNTNGVSKESGSAGESTRSDSSAGFQSSSEANMADGTKATVTVVKNPASNIMDGLLRRWDLNFFKK